MSILQSEAVLCLILTGSYQSHSCPVPWIKAEQDFEELWSTDPFCVLFLVHRIKTFIQPPWPFLSPEEQIQVVINQGSERIQKQKRKNQIMVQPWDRVLVPTKKNICIIMSLSSTELGPPPRWRMVTSGWARDFLGVVRLPYHQPVRKSHTPYSPHPKGYLLFLGPVMTIMLGILFGPCLFNFWEKPRVSS